MEETWQRANRSLDDDQKMPESDQTYPKVIPNGCQEMAKWRPKWTQNGVKLESSPPEPNWRAHVAIFVEILAPFGEPFGDHFGQAYQDSTPAVSVIRFKTC